MKKIMAAVDGSEHAYKALSVAATMANQEQAEVVLVHVASDKNMSPEMRTGLEVEYAEEIEKRVSALGLAAALPDEVQYARTMLSHSADLSRVVNTIAAENILKRSQSMLREKGIETLKSILLDGDPADRIIEASKSHDIDTIVMGCRGTGKIRGMLLGSVSQAVAHEADCSVIIVK